MSYDSDRYECPKCHAYSRSADVCDACGALISKIQDREMGVRSENGSRVDIPDSFEQHVIEGAGSANLDVHEENGSRLTAIAILILFLVGGAFWYLNNHRELLKTKPAPASTAPLVDDKPIYNFNTDKSSDTDKPSDSEAINAPAPIKATATPTLPKATGTPIASHKTNDDVMG